MHKRKLISLILAALLVLAGCSSTSAPSSSTAPASAPASSVAPVSSEAPAPESKAVELPSGPVTMRMSWWGGDSRHEATLKVIEAYSEKFPNVTIEGEYTGSTPPYLTKLLTQLAGKSEPDIMQVDFKWIDDFVEQKQNFVNLNDYADRFDFSQIDSTIIENYCVRDDFMLGVPIGTNALCLMYNVEAMKGFGIEVPRNPTWDDVIDIGTQVHTADPTRYFLIPQMGHYYAFFKSMMFQRLGTNPFNADGSMAFSYEDALFYFQYVEKLFESGTIPPVEETIIYGKSFVDQIPSWHEQKYLTATNGASTMSSMINATGFEVDVASFPVFADAKSTGTFTPVLSMMLSVSANSKNIDQAIDFVSWYSNDETAINIMTGERGIPVNGKARGILEAQDALMPQVIKAIEVSSFSNSLPENKYDLDNELLEVFNPYWQSIGYKKMTAEQAAEGYINDMTIRLEEMKNAAQ